MKRMFLRACTLAAAAFFLAACTTDRSQVLKIYNWSDYIAEGVLDEFAEWYEEQTGEKVKIVYQTFDVNEAMLSKIEMGQEDFDVVCPSDYIIERMLNNGLLLPLDFSLIPEEIDYIHPNVSPYIRRMFREINPDIDANDYSVAYMWGTTGILYNTEYVTREEASTWDVIRNPKFHGKILIKDAPRDVYGPVLIYLRQDELASGETTLEELMLDSSDKSLRDVKRYLLECAPGVYGWEADFGKDQMSKDRAWLSLNWSGDALWAKLEAADVGISLDYVVPEEGSTVWFDGWVIPKYAKNTKAANYFIDFMCRPDIAIRNMEETGYVASSGAWEVLESQMDEEEEPIDLSYFFGPDASEVRVSEILYPDIETIRRCALEHDWGDRTEALLSMWQDVKSSRGDVEEGSTVSWPVIGIFLAILGAAVYKSVDNSRKKKRRRV